LKKGILTLIVLLLPFMLLAQSDSALVIYKGIDSDFERDDLNDFLDKGMYLEGDSTRQYNLYQWLLSHADTVVFLRVGPKDNTGDVEMHIQSCAETVTPKPIVNFKGDTIRFPSVIVGHHKVFSKIVFRVWGNRPELRKNIIRSVVSAMANEIGVSKQRAKTAHAIYIDYVENEFIPVLFLEEVEELIFDMLFKNKKEKKKNKETKEV
jgi:hypothetical protein